jgi:hypothetical protein
MSLLSGMTPPSRKSACKVLNVINSLDPKDGVILAEAIANTQLWPARTLQNALAERKIIISDISIGRHRKGQCICA